MSEDQNINRAAERFYIPVECQYADAYCCRLKKNPPQATARSNESLRGAAIYLDDSLAVGMPIRSETRCTEDVTTRKSVFRGFEQAREAS